MSFLSISAGKEAVSQSIPEFLLRLYGQGPGLIEDCPVMTCKVFPYRMGRNPAKKGQGANTERMKKVRESMKKDQLSIFLTQDVGRAYL